jgi:hypothetical protein
MKTETSNMCEDRTDLKSVKRVYAECLTGWIRTRNCRSCSYIIRNCEVQSIHLCLTLWMLIHKALIPLSEHYWNYASASFTYRAANITHNDNRSGKLINRNCTVRITTI